MSEACLIKCTNCKYEIIHVFYNEAGLEPGYQMDRYCLNCDTKTTWVATNIYPVAGDIRHE